MFLTLNAEKVPEFKGDFSSLSWLNPGKLNANNIMLHTVTSSNFFMEVIGLVHPKLINDMDLMKYSTTKVVEMFIYQGII